LDERLVPFRRSDEDIVAQLKACEIPALSNMDALDAYDSYDYVLRMRMDHAPERPVVPCMQFDTTVSDSGRIMIEDSTKRDS
jgi:hypothetical protein